MWCQRSTYFWIVVTFKLENLTLQPIYWFRGMGEVLCENVVWISRLYHLLSQDCFVGTPYPWFKVSVGLRLCSILDPR